MGILFEVLVSAVGTMLVAVFDALKKDGDPASESDSTGTKWIIRIATYAIVFVLIVGLGALAVLIFHGISIAMGWA